MTIQDIVTLKAFIKDENKLNAKIEVNSVKGDKGDQGLSGDQPQPYAVTDTTIPSAHYWLRAHPRLAVGEKIIIESDAKLIVV